LSTTHAAVYARKSTDQSGVADEAKSVSRQIDSARRYAQAQGWTVEDQHVYVDDGISGAEFLKRPGLQRLMAAVERGPDFRFLIFSEESRLGRESIQTNFLLFQIMSAGIRVFSALNEREIVLHSARDKAMLTFQGMADEMERERARERTYDALDRKARAGHVTGGRVFGYENIDVFGPDGRKSHVERRVVKAQADVVRRIFALYAGGAGFTKIAKRLNEECVSTPRPQRGRPAGWSSSSVREVLYRPLYAGTVVWNRSKKRNLWGGVHQRPRPEQDWISTQNESLRIIPEELWDAVQQRLRAAAQRSKGKAGRPHGAGAKHLLTGFLRCGGCGAGIEVIHRRRDGAPQYFYGCSACQRKGKKVCDNVVIIPLAQMEDAVLGGLESGILHPAIMERAVERATMYLANPADTTASVRRINERRAELGREIDHLIAVITSGTTSAAVGNAIQEREAERLTLDLELKRLTTSPSALRPEEIGHELRAMLPHYKDVLRGEDTEAARELLGALFDERLAVKPTQGDRHGWEVTGAIDLRRLALRLLPHNLASPPGFEPGFQP
jgi:site-specific DNA recombinase